MPLLDQISEVMDVRGTKGKGKLQGKSHNFKIEEQYRKTVIFLYIPLYIGESTL